MNRKCKFLFTIEERVDLTAQIKAAQLVSEGIKSLKNPDPLFTQWSWNKLPQLLQQNPFPRTTPLPPVLTSNDYAIMKEEAPELLPQAFVVQTGELSFLACDNCDGVVREVSGCGSYPFHTAIAAADYLSGIYDESTVELYHASRYRASDIFLGHNRGTAKEYQDFIFERTEDGNPGIAEGDTFYAVEMANQMSPKKIAEVIQAHSPLAVFAADYGNRIITRSKLPIFASKHNVILR